MNERQFGARLTADGASFRLWAPAAKRVDLLLDKPHPLRSVEDGWFAADISGIKAARVTGSGSTTRSMSPTRLRRSSLTTSSVRAS
jgi:hypothetical protein